MKKIKHLILVITFVLSISICGNTTWAESNTVSVSEDEAYNSICTYLTQSGYDLQTVEDYNGYIIAEDSENDNYVFLFKSYTGAHERFFINKYSGEAYVSQENPIINEYSEKVYAYNVFDYVFKPDNSEKPAETTENKATYKRSLTNLEVNGYKIYNENGCLYVESQGECKVICSYGEEQFASRLISNGEYLFYAYMRTIYRYTLSSGEQEEYDSYVWQPLRCCEGYLYYEKGIGEEGFELKRINIDTKEIQSLGEFIELRNVVGKKIIYSEYNYTTMSYWKTGIMNMDGSRKEIFAENTMGGGEQYHDGNVYYIQKLYNDENRTIFDYAFCRYNIKKKEITTLREFSLEKSDYKYNEAPRPKISDDGSYIVAESGNQYYEIPPSGEWISTTQEAYDAIQWGE